MTVTMDKAGRIVIPLKLRQKLHLKAGTEFEINSNADGKVELEPRRREGRIVYKHGIPVLVFDDAQPASYDVVEEMRKGREEASVHVSGEYGYDQDCW
jgi:AbrB family looped-hinge helix DNA binding protein